MIPLSDDNPTLRTPVVTILLLIILGGVWLFVQGGGFDPLLLANTVCAYGMIPGELTRLLTPGMEVPLGNSLVCVPDLQPAPLLTPLTSMFLHASWSHLLGNCLFFWIFGNNIEDSMGRLRFIVFYLVCGLAAAAAHLMVGPGSALPTVGASGAISGVMGAYLVLYPRVRVRMLFIFVIFIRIISVPAWAVLLWWFGLQVLLGLPQLGRLDADVSSGVAVWAHVGGFIAGVVLIKLFENRALVSERADWRQRIHSDRW